MTITISPLTNQDIPSAVKCIQQAFSADPYNNWVFNNRETFSLDRNSVSLGLRCRWGMNHALFHVAKDTEGKVLGVACWMPPRDVNAPQTWKDWYGEWRLWVEQGWMNLWYGHGGLNVRRYYIRKNAQKEVQRELWRDSKGYYFCNIVTVLPEMQGKGVGKMLFKHVMDVADREGRACYLESSRAEPNMAIYEKMGFVLVKEMVCDDEGDAITLYCMMREPARV